VAAPDQHDQAGGLTVALLLGGGAELGLGVAEAGDRLDRHRGWAAG
jgi:hypothetical protein